MQLWLKKCMVLDIFPDTRHHGMALSAELVADLSAKLSQVQEGDRLVKTVHAAISQLESQGHVYTMQLQPAMVGISRQNRDGSGINPVDVHDLLGDIVSAGWLDARVQAILMNQVDRRTSIGMSACSKACTTAVAPSSPQ